MADIPIITLNNGVKIPQIGLGTWQSPPGQVATAVEYALKEAGYRHLDCAMAYGNQKEVAEGIRRSGIPREEIFITSKVATTYFGRVEEAINIILEDLGTTYVDLLLLHWPIAMNPNGNHPLFPTKPDGSRDIVYDWPLKDTWAALEALQTSGKARAIGISNFSQVVLEETLLPYAKILPAVNQIELHPYLPQHKLTSWFLEKGIIPQAYCPLGSTNSPLLGDEVVAEIAKSHDTTPAAVLIGWSVAKGFICLPKSVTPARIAANIKYAKLSADDVAKLDGLAASGKQHRILRPPWTGVKLGFEDWQVGEAPRKPT